MGAVSLAYMFDTSAGLPHPAFDVPGLIVPCYTMFG